MRRDLVLGLAARARHRGSGRRRCAARTPRVLIMTQRHPARRPQTSRATAVAALLGVVATVFIVIAVYVAAIVIVNGVDTVLAGRLPPDRAAAPAGRPRPIPAVDRRAGHDAHGGRRRRWSGPAGRHPGRRRVPRRAGGARHAAGRRLPVASAFLVLPVLTHGSRLCRRGLDRVPPHPAGLARRGAVRLVGRRRRSDPSYVGRAGRARGAADRRRGAPAGARDAARGGRHRGRLPRRVRGRCRPAPGCWSGPGS